MNLRGTASVVFGALVIGGSAAAFYVARPAASSIMSETVAPAAHIVTSKLGGTVVSVMVKAGDHVEQGQVLLRLHAGEFEDRADRVIAAFEKTPLRTLDRGASLIERIPAATWSHVVASDPQRLAAEQEYVSALAEHEAKPSSATQQRIQRALQKRVEAQSNIPHRDLFETLRRRQHDEAGDIAWLREQFDKGEMRAPIDGTVAIFDLHPGDKVSPNGRVLLIESETKP